MNIKGMDTGGLLGKLRDVSGALKLITEGATPKIGKNDTGSIKRRKRKTTSNSKRFNLKKRVPKEDVDDESSIDINTELNMESDHNFFTGFSEDIIDGGIFVATFDPKPIGSIVLVRFKLPGNNPVMARGKVQFVREENVLLKDGQKSGMGVQFTDLMESDREAIEDYQKKREPIFFDE